MSWSLWRSRRASGPSPVLDVRDGFVSPSAREVNARWLPAMRASGWVLPPALAADDVVPSWTRIGVVDGETTAIVDPRGLVTPRNDPLGLSLDWWVGAEDRWHLPAREAGVIQQRIDGAPVVETTMRVPGGHVVHRAYGARGPAYPGGDDWIVVEVENRSPVPVVVAWVLRPLTPSGITITRQAGLSPAVTGEPRGAQMLEGFDPFGLMRRPPSRWAHALGGTDPVHAVLAGKAEAGPMDTGALAHPEPELASAALLVPVPHTATTRVALFGAPFDIDAATAGPSLRGYPDVAWPTTLPDADAVVRGWSVRAERGPRVELPEPVLAAAVAAARRALPLCHRARREPASSDRHPAPVSHTVTAGDGLESTDSAADRMAILTALSTWGQGDLAAPVLARWTDDQSSGGHVVDPESTAATLGALAAHLVATGDTAVAEATLPELSGALEALRRVARRRRPGGIDPLVLAGGLDAGSVVLAALGQPDAARRVAAHAAEVRSQVSPGAVEAGLNPDALSTTPRALATVAVADTAVGRPARTLGPLLRRASPTWTWSDPDRWIGDDGLIPARLLTTVAQLLVGDRAEGLALTPWAPPDWWGLGWEVHDLPSRWGRLSYAVRWHGDRPALLWEVGDPSAVTGDPSLTAPGLDPAWRGNGRSGEALLAPVARPAVDDPA